jgi:hypothetical protein
MHFRDDDESGSATRFFETKLLFILIISAAGITFAIWFFFISGADKASEDVKTVLPPNCYSINGKQTCPKK